MKSDFSIIKNDILGKDYSLSIANVDKKKSRELNKKYRNIDKATNVLSFSLTKNSGELVLCPDIIKSETKKFGKTFEKLVGFLVIHGMLHLKGHEHSSTMDKLESKYDQKYFGRNRSRILDDEGRSRRIHKGRKKS
ncbi:MAG: rRNA maturation RNase YbeY [Patescibacteria group bacterium]